MLLRIDEVDEFRGMKNGVRLLLCASLHGTK
jgi:hypothetical protein